MGSGPNDACVWLQSHGEKIKRRCEWYVNWIMFRTLGSLVFKGLSFKVKMLNLP